MANHYQAHAGPGYYMQQQPPPQSTQPQNYFGPGPNPNSNPNANPGAPGPSNPNAIPNGYYAHAPNPYNGHHHPSMGSPRLNGTTRGTGYTNPQSARGGHGHASYAHAHVHSGYRPPGPNPYSQYPHPHPLPHPHPHAMPPKYPQAYPPYPVAVSVNPYAPPPPPPPSVWGQQHQQQPQQQQQQLSPLPKQDIPLASPLEVVAPSHPYYPSPTIAAAIAGATAPPLQNQNQNQNRSQNPQQQPQNEIPESLPALGGTDRGESGTGTETHVGSSRSDIDAIPVPVPISTPPPQPLAPATSTSASEPTSYGQISTSASAPFALPSTASASSTSTSTSSTLPSTASASAPSSLSSEPPAPMPTAPPEPASSPSSPQLQPGHEHEPTSPVGSGSWAIWSRRPHDPARAPGVIISPRARPPPVVVANATGGRTPPPSPPPLPLPTTSAQEVGSDAPTGELEAEADVRTQPAPAPTPASSPEQEEEAEAPSSGASTADNTDADADTTTAATTVPGSPVSSATSISLSAAAGNGKVLAEEPTAVGPKPAFEGAAGAAEVAALAPAQVPDATAASSVSPVPPAPAPAPAAPPPKKSWASLLRPPAPAVSSSFSPASGSSSTSTSTTAQQNQNQKPKWAGLPTSSVVGFSIPAAASVPAPAASTSTVNQAAVLALLNAPAQQSFADTTVRSFADASAPAAGEAKVGEGKVKASGAGEVGTGKITPRGLVNTGNMCFANAVLQVLVYCAPFAGLFAKLYTLLGAEEFDVSAGGGVGDFSTGPGGVVVQEKEGERVGVGAGGGVLRAAPLVRATGTFLREFLPSNSGSKASANGKKPVVGAGGGAGKGKGKASPEEREQEEEDGEAFIPTYVYDALKGKKRFDGMRGGHQEDAEEFLGFFLDTLEEELLAVVAALSPSPPTPARRAVAASANGTGRAVVEEREEEAPSEAEDGWLEVGKKNRTVVTRTIKTTESPMTRIFGGKFRSTLRAPGQKDSVIVEDWRSLRLDIQREGIHTIADALAFISHPQTVQMSHPSRPGVVVEASQQVLIDALPPILILHVKRFCYDTAVGGVVKVGKRVAFGPELEVGNDVMVPTARKQQPVKYKLFGVVYHHGVSASGGHYTLDVLHPTRFPGTGTGAGDEREGWVRIDDELVSDVRPADVFGAAEGDSRCAYLLFYKRIR